MSLKKRQQGYSILELAVAMTVLSLGSSVLWYAIKSASRLDRLNRLHHSALMAARSEMESLRLRPKENIHDTGFALKAIGGETLYLVRQVFDSTRIMATLDDIVLDEKLSPQELRKPLEVKVSILLKPAPGEGGDLESVFNTSLPWSSGDEGAEHNDRVLVTLILKIPEYRWY